MDEKTLVAYTAIVVSSEGGLHRPTSIAESLMEEKRFNTVEEGKVFIEKWMPVLEQLENWLDMAKALALAIPDEPDGEVKGL